VSLENRTQLRVLLTKGSFEQMVTRALCLGNIMILNAEVRRGAYWHLLEAILFRSWAEQSFPNYIKHVESVLRGVADRMGLTKFSDLFMIHASQIATAVRDARHDFLRIPSHLLGFQDRRQCAEATFLPFTVANLVDGGSNTDEAAYGRKLFLNHCKAIQKSASGGLKSCFSQIVGGSIVIWMDNHPDAALEDAGELKSILRATMAELEDSFDHLLHHQSDSIIVAILRTLGDQIFEDDGPIAQTLRQGQYGEDSFRVFVTLTRYRSSSTFRCHAPNLPSYSAITVFRALNWFLAWQPKADIQAASYHILHALLADIHASYLVNEQMRLINALTLWIAYRHRHFREAALLRTFLNGSTSLLAQSELSPAAKSMLEWAFEVVRYAGDKDLRLPDILIQICCVAHDFSRNGQDYMISQLGADLIKWIEAQTVALCQSEKLRTAVVEKALPAWPREPCAELAEMTQETSLDTLSQVLSDTRITANKFRMVRRLRDVTLFTTATAEQFARSDFWRLKECIPPPQEIQEEDVDAFAALLVAHKGHVKVFTTDQSNAQGLLSRHRRAARKREPGLPPEALPYRPIVQTLLTMMDKASGVDVHAAYSTLRLLMSGHLRDQMDLKSWSSEYRKELEYLQEYRREPQHRSTRTIGELATADTDPTDFPSWITYLTILLADVLATHDPLYVPLTTLLQSSPAFAEEMLPVLVHTILQSEITQRSSTASARNVLSDFFTSILKSSMSCIQCIDAVVNTVIHLRNFMPPQTSDTLAYDKWLAIDFVLLSRSAVACNSYTTALLFLELAVEHNLGDLNESSLPEDILFDIYSHIGEPDGFYGIKTGDLRQFLVKRLHHERQWDKAFQLHGAAIEASRSDPNEMEGVLQSLHAFGFNRLALSTLHDDSNVETLSLGATTSMSYSVGWRTETWDLPQLSNGQGSSAAVYNALKAVHRERDESSVNATVRSMLIQEMTRLKTLGNENVAEIQEVARSIMCLSQITQWYKGCIEVRAAASGMDDSYWHRFCSIDPDLEYDFILCLSLQAEHM
jgi:serine-protein kinase ATM